MIFYYKIDVPSIFIMTFILSLRTLKNTVQDNINNFIFNLINTKTIGDKKFHFFILVQGISYWDVKSNLGLTNRNVFVRFCLKVSVWSWGFDIWVSSRDFQRKKHWLTSTASNRKTGWRINFVSPTRKRMGWVIVCFKKLLFHKHRALTIFFRWQIL